MRTGQTFFRALNAWVNSYSKKAGGARYFQIELSSRYRWYLWPTRVMLIVLSWILGGSILWSVSQAFVAVRDRHDLQARLNQVRVQDHQLLAEVQREGLDLSGASLQQLPVEVGLANQLLTKRSFSWTQFLSALETAIPLHMSIQSIRLDPGSTVVHMTGLAVAVEDVTMLTVTLQNHVVFRDPVLGQHRVGPDGLIEFDLTVQYRQPGV
ncbi:MAG: hypothetical protein ABIR36_10130 [Nitrospiraceae bacterium]